MVFQVPSILMEYYANNATVLSKFAKHHKTREVLPPDVISKLCEQEKICAASEMQVQVIILAPTLFLPNS